MPERPKLTLRTFKPDLDYNVRATLTELVEAVTTLNAKKIPPDVTKPLRLLYRQIGSIQSLLESLRINFKRLDEQVNPPPIPHANPGAGAGGGGGGGGGTGGPGGGAGGGTLPVPLPNYYQVVADYFAANPSQVANSCQSSGGNWDLMDGIVDTLRAADSRFGYNGKRGNCGDPSNDAISYYGGLGGPSECAAQVYIIDVISGHCGPNPQPAFNDVTPLGPGAWISRGRF